MDNTSLYEHDFYAWIQHHIQLLKQGKWSEIDTEILIDELEGMAKRDRYELISHLKILIAHLLKWEYQLPQLTDRWNSWQGGSWQATIVEQRDQIVSQLELSPSLKNELAQAVEKAYPNAVKIAAKETQLAKSTFPSTCPYTLDQLLNEDFYPKID